METTKPSARVKKHGIWLLIWIWLMLLVNVIGAIANLGAVFITDASPFQSAGEIVPSWAFALLGLLGIANIVFAVLLLKWRMWGFYGVLLVTVLAFFINIIVGVDAIRALLGFIGPVILYFLMRPRWALFEK